MYQPAATDYQKLYERDECYVIIECHGKFEMGEGIVAFGPGYFLFVPAGLPHHFTNFDDKMSTCMMFHSPNSSENVNGTEKTS